MGDTTTALVATVNALRATSADLRALAARVAKLEQLEDLARQYEQAMRVVDEPPAGTRPSEAIRAAEDASERIRAWVRRSGRKEADRETRGEEC